MKNCFIVLLGLTITINAQTILLNDRVVKDPIIENNTPRAFLDRDEKIPVRIFEISNTEDLSEGVRIENSWSGRYSQRYLGVCPPDSMYYDSSSWDYYSYFNQCMAEYAVEEMNLQLSYLPNIPSEIFELVSYERIHDSVNYDSPDGHTMLSQYHADTTINTSGSLNIIITNSMANNLLGTTYLYQDAVDENGAILIVESEHTPIVIIHELGHLLGFPHLLEDSEQITFAGETISIDAIPGPNCEPNYMSSWDNDNCSFPNPNAVKYGDMNGDGIMDLVSASSVRVGSSGKFAWHEGNGMGDFTHHLISNTPDAYLVEIGDIDLDGDLDFATAASDIFDSNGHFSWYENDGAGVFTEHIFSENHPGASSVKIIDLDGDGDMDLVCGSKGDSNITLLINDGNESFTELNITPSQGDVFDVTIGDINGDGNLDLIVVGSEYVKTLSWFESDGSGSFTEHLVSDHAKVAAIPIDMDGDGDLDIVSFGDRLTLFYNDGNGGFANSLELGWGWDLGYYNPKELSIIDIDGDSDVDIVASYMNGVALFMQDSGNLLGAISIYSGSSINNSLPIQMNDDNHWDIIVSEHDPYHIDNDNDLFWLEGDGNNSWEIEHGITELLRLSLNTSQHGAVFGEILNSWLDYHYNYFDLAINDDLLPLSFALHQNYPNPFNPTTTLQYDLPEDAKVKIMIYDLMGRQVKTLVNNQQSAGFKSIIWGATNDLGQPVSAGMYLYRISAGDFHSVKKMILLK
ncbi:MAG: T9SS type A sorting domain-containing protein [Candidatus Marinimicrobia bacterium]|jgi:hypothetical protein|nr:T9SS type A sorting domain-containing protein [Candidatus Neomarinimicrobiota bacterium]MBT3839858.1 T9SS type A sorting domain-containing protein [Candidatus Neomarinimicrobiota bacterium]MBT3998446.1 T9SS type A sorting domain-containing protein [Candidatus Neomarinimicrobiota bacterium]MBT4282234.1 T9SS type A sorting domain-containing protein [Candidatus Neomarinimicrobiota bacterium]MBT4580189.1 T9SS type A sorting domain-containing protein [Candidatus Neomarinimicrobiota bacterium]